MSLRASVFVLFAAIVLTAGATLARSGAAAFQPVPNAKATPCKTSGVCFSETNDGKGAAIEGVSLQKSIGNFGQGAIVAQAKGLGGVYAFSKSSYGGEFESDGAADALIAASDDPSGVPFLAEGPHGGGFEVFATGNGFFTGTVSATNFIVVSERAGATVGAFAPEATRATIEDDGTARLSGGRGTILFDADFAQAIDAGAGYQVFLTPDGDTRGLYVAQKFTRGFTVREVQSGRSSILFDYRVVARPAGASQERLPALQLPRRPEVPREP